MGLGEALASHGQDEQGAEDVRQNPEGHGQDKHSAEDVRQVPAGCGQDKQGAKDARQVPAGHRQDKQDPGGARHVPAGCRQSRVGPEPLPYFLQQIGPRPNQPIVPLWQWSRIYPGDPFRPRNINLSGEEKILVSLCRNPTAQDFFKLYITEQIIDQIVIQTNL